MRTTVLSIHVFAARQRVIDQLRSVRHQGHPLAATDEQVEALLEEINLLHLVAQAAEDVMGSDPSGEATQPCARLKGPLARWSE
jgi:hypothetical protein